MRDYPLHSNTIYLFILDTSFRIALGVQEGISTDIAKIQRDTLFYNNDEIYSYCHEDHANLYGDVNLTANQTSVDYEDVPATVTMPGNFRNKLAFMGMVFPDNAQMLNDPNVWIGDSAATVHFAAQNWKIVPYDNQSSEQVITVGNGTSKMTTMSGIIYNKEGLE